MPIETRIDAKTGLRTHTVTGELTFDHVSAALEEVYADPDFLPHINVLWDLRGAILNTFSSADIAKVVDVVRGNWTGARAALVVARDVDFGIARMYEMQHDPAGGEVRVFRGFEEAKSWVLEKE